MFKDNVNMYRQSYTEMLISVSLLLFGGSLPWSGKFITVLLLLLGSFLPQTDADIVSKPRNTVACIGDNLTLDWVFANETELNSVTWLKGSTRIATKTVSADAVIPDDFANKVKYISNGQIQLLNVSVTDEDIYMIAVSYIPGSQLPRVFSSVNVSVQVPPGIPRLANSSATSEEYTCSVSYPGKPAAEIQIKVDSDLKLTKTAKVTQGQRVECCITGDAVVCLDDSEATTYCIEVAGNENDSSTPRTLTGSTGTFTSQVPGVRISESTTGQTSLCRCQKSNWRIIFLIIVLVRTGSWLYRF